MSLENKDTLDMATMPLPGDSCKLVLYIIDSTKHDDELERYQMFIDKLGSYVTYVMSDDFKNENPGTEPSDVLIRVLTITEPNDSMLMVERIGPKNQEHSRMEVQFRDYNEFMSAIQKR